LLEHLRFVIVGVLDVDVVYEEVAVGIIYIMCEVVNPDDDAVIIDVVDECLRKLTIGQTVS